ncbi:hypothetical protein USDA257_c28170 [Sinorhizobium fredii USDA 257]|uniref:Uncharacterized protein n=1 Tax=Sinorhizobium fredii (strain USDA 257) TaxID=1185652 RepID=I3X682_SINF2|nr:hypothetical protein USDA257_c28170 [Sinorhizobium fredii USDA 257]
MARRRVERGSARASEPQMTGVAIRINGVLFRDQIDFRVYGA